MTNDIELRNENGKIVGYDSNGNKVPVTFEDGAFDSVSTDEASVGSSPVSRPVVSNQNTTVYVDPVNGSDTGDGTQSNPIATIQEAVDRCPIYLRHQYTVDLTTSPSLPVTYDEDVLIDSVIGTGQGGINDSLADEAGPVVNLLLDGDSDTPSNVEVGSITVGSCVGTATPRIDGVHILREGPYYEELNGIAFYGTEEGSVWNVEFDGGTTFTRGVLAYASGLDVRDVDVSNCDIGLSSKRGGHIQCQRTTGNANEKAHNATESSTIIISESSASAPDPPGSWFGSTAYDIDNRRLYRDSQRERNWYSLFTTTDTDDTTTFDVDTGSLPESPEAMLVDLYLETPSTSSGTVDMRVNGVSASDYLYTDISGTTSTGESEIKLGGFGGNESAYGQLLVSSANSILSGDKYVSVAQSNGFSAGSDTMQVAKLNRLQPEVDSLRIWSNTDMVGRMDVYGYTFGK
ncbi:hypothetical protein G9C85_02625 [Halorubellus sp. JP-L1]|uniref:hypothetical protein n=1 Tax=Halorubellus sp. JP-L1 TaxID=2715753 RepID=UPI0014092B78|nr:hypothetical protein [Halorubellus sp. JP-L1]NHN40533.1 hypothetical protein [Halorubellus sp. JP-L1]